jgi:hypothetical protein
MEQYPFDTFFVFSHSLSDDLNHDPIAYPKSSLECDVIHSAQTFSHRHPKTTEKLKFSDAEVSIPFM